MRYTLSTLLLLSSTAVAQNQQPLVQQLGPRPSTYLGQYVENLAKDECSKMTTTTDLTTLGTQTVSSSACFDLGDNFFASHRAGDECTITYFRRSQDPFSPVRIENVRDCDDMLVAIRDGTNVKEALSAYLFE